MLLGLPKVTIVAFDQSPADQFIIASFTATLSPHITKAMLQADPKQVLTAVTKTLLRCHVPLIPLSRFCTA